MSDEPRTVDQIADSFWERYLELSPLSATVYGDKRYDDRLPDPGPEGRAKARQWAEDILAAAAAIPDDGLTVEDRITRDMLQVIGELTIAEDDHRLDTLQVVDQMGGPQTLLPQMTQFQSADTPLDFDNFVSRLHGYTGYMAANIELLREAEASGLTAPRIVAERTIAQLERMLAIPIDQAIVPSMIRVSEEDDREEIRRIVEREVYPADRAFLDELKGSYFEKTRTEPGLWSAPNGEEIYRTEMLRWTTLVLDPREVHESGLAEIEEIESERRRISKSAGFGDDTRAYRAALMSDPANIPESREALVARALEDIERATAAMPKVVRKTPAAACRVIPV